MAVVAAALAHDQALGGAHAAGGAVHRDGLVENEIGAKFKGLLHRGLAVDNGESNAALIRFSLAKLAHDRGTFRHIVAIDEKRVKLLPAERQACLVRIVTELGLNVGRVQYAAQSALDLRITAEEERLKSHIAQNL